jgi:predicted component of type VI protein secretion system
MAALVANTVTLVTIGTTENFSPRYPLPIDITTRDHKNTNAHGEKFPWEIDQRGGRRFE